MEEPLGAESIGLFHQESRAALEQIAPLLRRRANEGHVRRCHDDLHLRNIVLLDGMPVPFDALEFDEVLGTCDVLYDLAFLIMDLQHRNLGRAANMVLNAYLLSALGDEDERLAALPLFVAVRAAIRAMVSVQTSTATGVLVNPEAAQFLRDALRSLRPSLPKLFLVGGISGTGKTRVSQALAPLMGRSPGAVHLRSDLERKAMRGIEENQHLPSGDYAPAARTAVYDGMLERTRQILATGHSVLLDATFLDPKLRAAAQKLAVQAGVVCQRVWLAAPLAMLTDRVKARQGDASDADEQVVRQQSENYEPPSDWLRISAAGSFNETVELAEAALHLARDSHT